MKRPFNNPLIQFVLLFSDDNSGTSVSGKQSIVKKIAFLKERAKRFLSSRALCALILGIAAVGTFGITLPHSAMAGPDQVVVDGNVATAKGDQSLGIKVDDESVTTLEVNSLDPNIIQPSGTGVDGINFESTTGGDVTIYSGKSGTNVVITTGDDEASGIVAGSKGTPPSPVNDPFLGIPIPGQPEVSGGVIRIDSHSDITTSGNNAHGIEALSNTSGYPDSVITDLENFSDAGISFKVTSVLNPDGSEGGIANQVKGHILELGDDGQFVGYFGEGGIFTLNEDGSYSFDPGTTDFNDLNEGESRVVSVKYVLEGYRDGELKRSDVTSELFARVTKTDTGYGIETHAYFDDYGESTRPADTADPKALPDLNSYVAGLIDTANDAGGSGNSVSVTHYAGDIKTSGSASHGILAESRGKVGSRGRNGGGFWSFGTRKPTGGGAGSRGGNVTVFVDGTITIKSQTALDNPEDASVGVFAHSLGGNGGRGGNGGTWYDGRRGGTGGDSGTIYLSGNAIISTLGNYSSGIFALSEGGNGGDGGDGGFVTDGKHGGFGGMGGDIIVDGSWDITTQGENAHGIWAKSTGGKAGTGGSGGWLAGSPAPGGQASDGGNVTVNSGGTIETIGNDSYGIFGQSVGGFGGSGGSGGSIFYTRGGDGNSAGSGGEVSVTNLNSGTIITHGEGSHAVFAESVGGGGGSGGGAGAIVGIGGQGAAGGHGGTVAATNKGLIQTFDTNALGIYAQSVGGGGGDGGYSGGLVAIGGGGSGTSDGGTVTVTNDGIITTNGAVSNAIFGQSIGGGGGNGGSSSGWFSIGGTGGGGGNADSVLINNSGQLLQTSGMNSSAIFAQSIGGGGGNGGNSSSVGSFVSLAIGGEGAAGGEGAEVSVNSSNGVIDTFGNSSHGIQAQSVGGGGGNGGFAFSASAGAGASVAIGIGGKGGGGGDSGLVNLISNGTISTIGDDSTGIFAESIGGGGGSGGFAIALAGSDGFSASFAIGGKGGDGGNGKAVDVLSTGSIGTSGNRAHGLQAQSVGGGGGNGGFSIAGSGGGLGAFSLGLGGSGAGGGDSDTVNVESSGFITTLGEESYGLFAQSVGGGGGNGGFTIAAAGAGVGAGAVGIGGSGGGGGNSKSVTVNNQGMIDTSGEKSIGLFAQSVGGGGGNGGFSISGAGAGTGAGTFNLGGSGGGGGDSDTVLVDSYGDIVTRGKEAHGLLAQSVGGGGGNGGFSLSFSGAGTGAGSISIGGAGGDGGNSMGVTVNSYGTLGTSGDSAIGLFAQSVGGGGGNGGFSISGSGAGTGAGTFNLGGSGGGGGNSDTVHVGSYNDITTTGLEAHGLFAQSVGGGGGNGGFGITGSGAGTGSGSIGIGGFGGDGGNSKGVTVSCLGEIDTSGDKAIGLFAQSVGGGGGSGSFSISGSGAGTGAGTFNLGGAGGGGGNSDFVTVDAFGHIVTRGTEAYGILAQSVGGGGGNGGFSITGSGAGTGSGSIGIGGFAGDGGDGKAVTVNNASIIDTYGHSATGLFAQSVGGGGGTGGFSIAGSGAKTGSGSFSLGGSGGLGGDGDIVHVDNQNTISTNGELAYGIMAQSVGGGGGAGGFSFSGGVTTDGFVMSASVGGSGGAGGNAGSVNLTNDGMVTTTKNGSHAIFAQSVGGGGGSGGFSGSLTASSGSKPNISISVGGAGGVAGDGGYVQLDNHDAIYTTGVTSYGLFAQSVGGGGGDGGGSFAAALGSHEGGANLSVSVGGFGGAAVNAGNVVVGNDSLIITEGIKSHGIAAQSIGGGGGTGGFSATGSLNIGTSAKNLAVSVGGFGGVGGDAGSVDVHNTGSIYTLSNFSGDTPADAIEAEDPLDMFNDGAIGILAQSIGGGGGNGGFSFAGSFAGSQAKNLSVSVGGSGGAGGKGMGVNVINENTIDTTGAYSYGILAQSIGGGGGNGGTSIAIDFGISDKDGANQNVAVSVGGGGGDGNIGGAVDVVNSSGITTRGYSSHGILVQSIGGGGGNGGFSLAGTVTLEKGEEPKQPVNISMAIGGAGGAGSHGETVTVDNSGTINTYQDGSCGIFAQSIGGGGGIGGSARALTLDVNPDDWIPKLKKENINDFLSDLFSTWNLAIGGSGGGASEGGSVTVVNRGNIVTQGAESHGIFAQSVGGGGGLGGDASHGIPYVPTWLEPFLELTPLKGLEDMQIVVGGSGGSSCHGDIINVNNESNITTIGHGSSGIFVQSIGGGGGVGGSGAVGLVGNIGLGGAAGASGDGGDVTVDHDGQIETYGSASYGIFAQSIGGGGGLAGNVDKGLFDFGIGLSFAREGGDGGDGGHVAVTSNGSIMTSGEGATGIIAQSVGGGGGLAGNLGVGIGFVGSVGGQGSAGTVSIDHSGDIITFGNNAHGIFAQSAGGKQSAVVTSYLGLGGKVNVILDGNIIIQGADADGILAQSIGIGGVDDITINVISGMVQGGSGTGTGVRFLDGADNLLANHGVITTVSGIEGFAVSGTTGNETIDNYGTVTGNVDLSGGMNGFNNKSSGLFNSGSSVNLGNGNTLTNAGILSPGGSEAPLLTVLNGDFTQSTGTFEANVYCTGDHDKLLVDNGSVSLDGTLSVIKAKGFYFDGIKYDLLRVAGPGNITGNFSDINLPAPTPLLSFDISQQPNFIQAEAHAKNFTTVAMNRVEGAIAKHLDRIMPTASGDLFNVMGVFQSLPASDLSAAFSSLSPGQYDNSTITTYNITRQYTKTLLKRMHSVRLTGETTSTKPRISAFVSGGETLLLAYNGSDASISQLYQAGQQEQPTHGIWFDGFGQWGDQDEHDGFTGFDYNVYGATLGFDHIISDKYIVGISVGHSHTDIDVDKSQGDGEIETIYSSLYGSYYTEKMYVDAALSYGSQNYDNERRLVIGHLQREARSEHDGDVFTAFTEAGYNFDLNRWLLQPFASLQYIDLDEEGFTEKGADSLNQIIDGRETESLVSELGLRLAYIFQMDSASLIPEVSAAWNYDFDIDDRVITTSFAGAPTNSFSIDGQDVEQNGVRIGAGLTLMAKGGFTTSVRYSGEFREDCQTHSFIGGIRFEF